MSRFYNIFFFLSLLLLSCNSSEIKNDHKVIGNYVSKEYSNLEKLYMNINRKHISIGSSLNIKKDSTFLYQTCVYIMSGNWNIKEDTLSLFVKGNRWRNDSLNLTGYNGKHPSISEKPLNFKIEDKDLIREVKTLNNDSESTMTLSLQKIE